MFSTHEASLFDNGCLEYPRLPHSLFSLSAYEGQTGKVWLGRRSISLRIELKETCARTPRRMLQTAAFVLVPILLFPGGVVPVLSTAEYGGGNCSPAILWHHK